MYRKIIKVFLGSPGDLEAERKAAKVIVDEENANHANKLGYHIDLVGWEDTVAQRRRAQDAINVDLDQCEYFVGLMWKKWGTPPGQDGHPYSSGFEEEYRRSVERHEKTEKPEISLLFKNIPEDDLIDVGKQLEKVLSFQEEINREKKGYYQKFEDLRDFEQKFRAIIAKFLSDQQLEDENLEVSEPKKPKLNGYGSKEPKETSPSKQIFEIKAREFLNGFLEKEAVAGAYNAAEAARFRLLASTVSEVGNDDLELGTHDANLIYRYLRNADLSWREHRGLISAGLENLESSTVPIWHWLFEMDLELQNELPIRTIISATKKRRSAFQILEKLAIAPKDFTGPINKSDYYNIWFAEDAESDLVIAALDYLGAVGDLDSEIDWANLTSSSEANISRAAVRASVRITARKDTTEALRIVAENENVDLGNDLTEELFSKISTIETDVLRGCLKNRTTSFLKAISIELNSRSALTKSDAQLLCKSADAETRLVGVKALSRIGPTMTLPDVWRLLVKPRKPNMLGFGNSSQAKDYPGENAFEEYKSDVLSMLPYEELLELQKEESFYSNVTLLATYLGHFKKTQKQLEVDLLDGFESYCNSRRSLLLETSAEPSPSVFSYIRGELLQSAFEIFCSKASRSDLRTIRKVIDEFEIKYSNQITEYLARFGEWEDAARVAKLSEKYKSGLGLSLLSLVDHTDDYRVAAKTILRLGSKRIADVWNLELTTPVRVQLIVEMPKKVFAAFDDQSLVKMLTTEIESVRRVLALKAVLCLTKTRLRKILANYYNVDGTHYYNVIFWMDLGVSADRSTSQDVARKELISNNPH